MLDPFDYGNMTQLCNCGREVRYSHMVDQKMVGSCNKHVICPTYAELEDRVREGRLELAKSNKQLKTLKDAIKILDIS